MNKTWSLLLWLIGEAVILYSFVWANPGTIPYSLMLKMLVSSIIFTVLIISIFRNQAKLSKRGVSNGMKWFFTLTYALLAIAAMLYFEFLNPVDLLTQTIVQAIFLSVLFMGMWGAFKSGKRIHTDQKYEKMEQRQLMMIRNVVDVARTRAERTSGMPPSIVNEIIDLQQEVQQISPGNEYTALKMEGKIMMDANQIIRCLKNNPPDLNMLQSTLKHCFKLIREFRSTYSAPLTYS